MINASQPTKTGLYPYDMLGEFQRRYAWQHEFEFPLQYEMMPVGDSEQISFHRTREPAVFNRAESEFSLIKTVVSTGDVPREYHAAHTRVKTDVEQIERRLQDLEGNTTKAMRSLLAAERALEDVITEVKQDKVKRAAGYIVARDNLWVVTHADVASSTSRDTAVKVHVAKLTGLTFGESVLPVVVGKNGLSAYVNRPPYDRRFGNIHPMNVLRSQQAD